jgi:hypothetical protein
MADIINFKGKANGDAASLTADHHRDHGPDDDSLSDFSPTPV